MDLFVQGGGCCCFPAGTAWLQGAALLQQELPHAAFTANFPGAAGCCGMDTQLKCDSKGQKDCWS